jgi:hypothetical protein
MKRYLLAILIMVNCMRCSSDAAKEDIVAEVPKTGSIATNVKVEHLSDSLDVLITEHKIWKTATDSLVKTVRDTIPSLGNTTVKDENGNNKTVKKDYDIYITVK